MRPLTVQVRLGLGFSADLPGEDWNALEPRRGSLRPEREVIDLRFIVHILHGKIHISYFMNLRGGEVTQNLDIGVHDFQARFKHISQP